MAFAVFYRLPACLLHTAYIQLLLAIRQGAVSLSTYLLIALRRAQQLVFMGCCCDLVIIIALFIYSEVFYQLWEGGREKHVVVVIL